MNVGGHSEFSFLDSPNEYTAIHVVSLVGARQIASPVRSIAKSMGRSPIAALNGSKLVVGGGFGITTYDTADHDQTQGYPFPRFTTALTVDASR